MIQVAGVFWFLAGCVALYLALIHLSKDMILRSRGRQVTARVVSESKTMSLYKNGSYLREITEGEQQRFLNESGTGITTRIRYSLKYEFELPGYGKVQGRSESGFSSGRAINSAIEVIYLPSDPAVNKLATHLNWSLGAILFWSVGGILWIGFFMAPAVALFFLGREKESSI